MQLKNQIVLEWQYNLFTTLLQKYKGNLSAAARELEIDHSNFKRICRDIGLDVNKFRPTEEIEELDDEVCTFV